MMNQVRRSSDALSIAMASRTEIIQWVVAAIIASIRRETLSKVMWNL